MHKISITFEYDLEDGVFGEIRALDPSGEPITALRPHDVTEDEFQAVLASVINECAMAEAWDTCDRAVRLFTSEGGFDGLTDEQLDALREALSRRQVSEHGGKGA